MVAAGQLDAVLDEQSAEATLEVPLDLAVAGGVGFERGPEVRAAGVAATKRAFDVGWACVVVKPGFGQSLQKGAAVVAGGEVEEGARDRGGRKTGIEEEVSGAQAASVEGEARGCGASSRHGELDPGRRGGDDLPAASGRPVAEDGAIACGQQSGNEESVLSGELRRLCQIHALVDPVQPAGAQGAVDRGVRDAGGQQLRSGDDPLLPSGDHANCVRFLPVSESNPTQLGHQVMVDRPPPAEQDGFVSSLLIACPDTRAKRTTGLAAGNA